MYSVNTHRAITSSHYFIQGEPPPIRYAYFSLVPLPARLSDTRVPDRQDLQRKFTKKFYIKKKIYIFAVLWTASKGQQEEP